MRPVPRRAACLAAAVAGVLASATAPAALVQVAREVAPTLEDRAGVQ